MKKIIGLDIGASKTTAVAVGEKGPSKEKTITTAKNLAGFKIGLKNLAKFISEGKKIKRLGIGFAGMADKRGKIVYCPNMKFAAGFNLKRFFSALGAEKIKIENDANCFALAESRLGQGKNLKNFIGITLGTGIGSGLILRGNLYAGARGSAGEVGHMMAGERQTYENLFKKYRGSKKYRPMGKLLGRMFADIYNLLDVQAIILGGSVAKSVSEFLPDAVKEARARILNRQIKPKILVSKLKNAAAVGAALLWS